MNPQAQLKYLCIAIENCHDPARLLELGHWLYDLRRERSTERRRQERRADERFGDSGSSGDSWATEPDVGRVAHGITSRVDRLKGLGNAVVPQIAEWIGRRIVKAAGSAACLNTTGKGAVKLR